MADNKFSGVVPGENFEGGCCEGGVSGGAEESNEGLAAVPGQLVGVVTDGLQGQLGTSMYVLSKPLQNWQLSTLWLSLMIILVIAVISFLSSPNLTGVILIVASAAAWLLFGQLTKKHAVTLIGASLNS